MKLERTTKDYGGGSGHGTYESDLFRVVEWYLSKGVCTEIELKIDFPTEIRFEGRHNFTSDESCMEQFTPKEIIKTIEYQKKASFQEGRKAKTMEIRKCLVI